MNEAVHPVMRQYEHEHTKQWSAKIEEANAFIIVTAEYDYSYPAKKCTGVFSARVGVQTSWHS